MEALVVMEVLGQVLLLMELVVMELLTDVTEVAAEAVEVEYLEALAVQEAALKMVQLQVKMEL